MPTNNEKGNATKMCHFSVSPYLKSLSMVAANKLLHLLEVSPYVGIVILAL